MRDEELRDLRRGALLGDEAAFEELVARARRELEPAGPPPLMVSYRAKDREEFWRLCRGRRAAGVDDDGLAPNEDPRRALEVCDARLINVWRRGDIAIARIQIPSFPRTGGREVAFVEAIWSDVEWPESMRPREYRHWSG